MVVASVELIVFAIEAGVRLIQTGRKVYVEATVGGDVVVPLPPVFAGINSPRTMARNHADRLRTGDAQAKKRFRDLYHDALAASFATDPGEAADGEWRLVQVYLTDVAEGLVPSVNRAAAELASVAMLEQWQQGKNPFPSPIQRIAGTLAEIAIDYFVDIPGALGKDSKRGKALQQLLSGLDDVRFADARWDSLVVSLFTAALDTLEDHPDLVSGDEEQQSLIRTIVAGVAKDLGEKLVANPVGDLGSEARIKLFGQIALRSLLRNAGTTVVASPSVLGLEDGAGRAMVQSVGSAFLELLLGEDSLADGLRRVASTIGFDKLMEASLKAVVEHPDLFRTGSATADAWLRGVLRDLYDRAGNGKPFFDPDLFVAVATSAIDRGLRELPALLKPGATGSTALIEIARAVFDRLTTVVGSKPRWQVLQLSRSDLADLFTAVCNSMASHTAWFHRRGQLQSALKAAIATIPAIVECLGDLGDGSLKALVRSGKLGGVLAAALASGALPATVDPAALRGALTKVLDMVWTIGANGAERLLDENVLLDLLSALAESGAVVALTSGDDAKMREALTSLGPVLASLRKGEAPTVKEMAQALAS